MLLKKFILLIVVLTNFNLVQASAPEFWYNKSLDLQSITNYPVLQNLNYDESINYQPGLNLYQVAAQLTDLYGSKGSQLCAPIAITHGFTYLKYPAGFEKLATIPDMDIDGYTDSYYDKIRYFFHNCATDKEIGTRYHSAIACIKEYVRQSGYTPYVYIVGAHSIEAPPGVPLETMRHVLNVNDIRTYVGNKLMVLMGIGWYEYDANTNSYVRQGGHFINLYGYDYLNNWGQDRINLRVVNNWIDYSARPQEEMYDLVEMIRLPTESNNYPQEVMYELSGIGFNFSQKAFVEDLFVALPLN